MNYSNHHALFTRKVAGYDFYTCRRALMDCHDTLEAQGQDIASLLAGIGGLLAAFQALSKRPAPALRSE